jgi:S1-C subfamily serine protease
VPPAHPLPVAPDAPRLGEPVTSIGFPGLNIADTDGIDLDALLAGNKTPAEVLQDSRLQPANTSGTITARQYRHGVAVYQVSAGFDHGMSGGPTLNSRGQVLGMNSQMTVPFLGQNFNISAA